MEVQTFDDVFDALADTPAEAANMKARADLLSLLVQQVKSWGLPQYAAAARLGITRPRLSDLMCGKLGKFSLDALVNLAAAAGLVLEIRAAPERDDFEFDPPKAVIEARAIDLA
jgi:predicted XRE-type DNA-binding protein